MKTLLAAALLIASNVLAQASVLLVPLHFHTVQEAINASVDGDMIIVADGTYKENINFGGKDVWLRSWNKHGAVIIGQGSWQNPSPVVSFINGETNNAVLDGFVVRNGTGFHMPGSG
ncbi:MAG: hypothetical protein ABIK28_05785 [Planctomycetota bacterium]